MHFGCMLNAHFSPSLFELFFSAIQVERCIFWKYKCNKRHIHCTIFPSAFYLIFFLLFWNRPHAYTFSFFFLSVPHYLDYTHTHTNRFIHDDTQNELYLKAKWMLYYDAGSGLLPSLLLDFFFYSEALFRSPFGSTVHPSEMWILVSMLWFFLVLPHTHTHTYTHTVLRLFIFLLFHFQSRWANHIQRSPIE